MKLRVLSVFGTASLQDAGRPGYRRFGVPVAGAFDRESFHLANALLGNRAGAPAMEFALGTLDLEAQDASSVAVVGAATLVTVNDRPVACNGVVGLRAGDRLTVHPPERGLRTYVAAPGGFVAPDVLGSASGTPIETGDVLESRTAMELAARHLADPPTSLSERPLRALVVRDGWLDAAYGVGRTLDRVGLRLEGPKPMVDARSGTSEPSVSGAVQLTEDRTLIVHGPDGPTIGGYVKLGFIVTADLDRTAQLAPGDRVEFRAVSLDEARGLRAEHQKTLQALVRRVATAGGGSS